MTDPDPAELRSAALGETQRYVYAIVRAADAALVPLGDAGLDGAAIDVVRHGDLAAFVSDVGDLDGGLSPEQARAHDAVVRRIDHCATVLPMRPGLVFSNDGEVVELLGHRHGDLAERLERLDGRVEMSLLVRWDVDDALSGKVLDQARASDRAVLDNEVLEACEEVRWLEPRERRESVRLAALVRSGAVRDFEDAARRAASQFDDRYVVEVGGPYPPRSFVGMRLMTDAA